VGNRSRIFYSGDENNIFVEILSTFYHNATYPSRAVAMQLSKSDYDKEVKKTINRFLFPLSLSIPRSVTYLRLYSALRLEMLPYLTELYPDIYILQIVRNSIAVTASRSKYEGFKQNSYKNHIETWNRGVDISKEAKKVFSNRYKLVHQEDFLDVEKAREQLNSICEWLGIPYEESLLHTIANKKFHPTGNKNDVKNLRNRAERWKEWSTEKRSLFKQLAAENMAHLGYQIAF
jgi:hypothetical protein